MHKIEVKKIGSKLGEKTHSMIKYLQLHSGQIAYYACVALVLTAVAVAAERFREGEIVHEELVLPAVELATPAPKEPEPLFELQEGMQMLRGYNDQPEWNNSLRHWETHAATDYACPGGEVRSLSDGVVKTVGKSGVYGGFVEVEAGEHTMRYASVEPSDGLEPGKMVRKGDLLALVDDSMPGEAYMDAHLHLELVRDGRCLDFAKEKDKKVAAID